MLVFLAARTRRTLVLGGVLAATWLVGWMKAADWLPRLPEGPTAVAIGFFFVAAGWGAWQLRGEFSGFASGVVAGGLATWLWAPCVGKELGTILNAAPESPGSQLIPIGLFVLGLSIPLLVIGLLPVVFPSLVRVERPLASAAMGLVVFIGVAMMLGWYDDVVIQLNQWSVGAA
ncbi:MAG: hypothetical protein KJO36_04060 [Acidimicrobiia bacterium]|nr:hypothetical protein [Acidimicrobiia bacterium]NNC42993.1 hypothetical protein [Acidimicrobiia bacterium]